MKSCILWIVWYLTILNLAVGIDLDSCNCNQCRHVSEIRDRCECCVFLLHGKRSASTRNSAPNQNDSPSEISSSIRPKRKPFSYIFDSINSFGMQRKSSEPKKHSKNQRMSFDTVNLPRHLNAFMIMKNRRNGLDYSDMNDDVVDDFERQNRHRNPFGYRLKAMEPFYFQYKPMAENQFQAGDKSVIRPLTDFSSDYDFENGDEYNDFFDTDDVVDAVQGPGDSVGLY